MRAKDIIEMAKKLDVYLSISLARPSYGVCRYFMTNRNRITRTLHGAREAYVYLLGIQDERERNK